MAIEIDKGHDIPSFSKVCTFCKNWIEDNERHCRAFTEQFSIPLVIWTGKNKHTKPFPGDNGIQFERIEEMKS